MQIAREVYERHNTISDFLVAIEVDEKLRIRMLPH
jgi:Mn-dependent DtxR family transcriptional regulator